MKNVVAAAALLVFMGCAAQEKTLLLDDFEGTLSHQTVDFGSGNGSQVNVQGSSETVYSGTQSLRVDYTVVSGGYLWVARGYQLDAPQAAQWSKKPQDINWKHCKGIAFYLYGEAKGAQIAFDIKDANREMFRTMITDDTKGWRRVVCPFSGFVSRSDWQPGNAVVDRVLNFPVMSFQFEAKTPGKGVFYVDKVELLR